MVGASRAVVCVASARDFPTDDVQILLSVAPILALHERATVVGGMTMTMAGHATMAGAV
jgi:hypothetical protein